MVGAAVAYLLLGNGAALPQMVGGKKVKNVVYKALPDNLTIETPYADLRISEEWKDALLFHVDNGDSCRVSFAAGVKNTSYLVFDVYFNSQEGNLLGYLSQTPGNQVSVSVYAYDLVLEESLTQEEKIGVYGMQEELSNIIAQLPLVQQEEAAAVLPQVCVETPYGQLQYPGIWKDYIRTEVKTGDSCVVSFFGTVPEKEEQQLFDVVIGGSGEVLMGTLNADTGSYDVSITMYPLNTDSGWSVEDSNLLFGMQDSVNDVIAALTLTGTAAQESAADETELSETTALEPVSVETPYGVFSYSGNWKNHIRTAVTQDNSYVISFYGSVPEKQEQHLFDIAIGGTGDSYVGMFTKADGSLAEVYIRVSALPEEALWNAEETELFYGMQDVLNEVLDQLSLTQREKEVEVPTVDNGGAGDITVSVDYATLSYPGKWRNNLRTEVVYQEGCMIRFFGTAPGYDEMHLFDIVINGPGDIVVGMLTSNQGNAVQLCMNISEILPAEGMTDDALTMLLAMQDDVNYILENLESQGKLSY